MTRPLLLLSVFTLAACTTATQRPTPAEERAALESPATAPAEAPSAPAAGGEAAAPAPKPEAPVDRPALRTDNRVSASAGEAGGVVVLWPRIIPADAAGARTPQAAALQKKLTGVADVELMGWAQDVRPAPERVCPQAGCKGVSLGVLLVHKAEGCAAVALVSRPGRSAAQLVPWAGKVTVKRDFVPFREPPESEIVVHDFVPCGDLAAALSEKEPAVRAAVRGASKPAN